MRLNLALICSFLPASAVLAGVVPKNDRPPQFLDHRRQAPNLTYYNHVMAGAFLQYNGTADFVAGTFSVPNANASSQDGTAVYFLVGMGSLTGSAAAFGGINLVINNQQPHYKAFSWSAPYLANVSDLEVSPGDNIRISVNGTSANTVTVKIENLTTNRSDPIKFDFPSDQRQIAGCFVADKSLLEPTVSSVGMPDFHKVTFNNVETTGFGISIDGPRTAVIRTGQEDLTSVSVNGSSITITQL